jgi:hypothetical protein
VGDAIGADAVETVGDGATREPLPPHGEAEVEARDRGGAGVMQDCLDAHEVDVRCRRSADDKHGFAEGTGRRQGEAVPSTVLTPPVELAPVARGEDVVGVESPKGADEIERERAALEFLFEPPSAVIAVNDLSVGAGQVKVVGACRGDRAKAGEQFEIEREGDQVPLLAVVVRDERSGILRGPDIVGGDGPDGIQRVGGVPEPWRLLFRPLIAVVVQNEATIGLILSVRIAADRPEIGARGPVQGEDGLVRGCVMRPPLAAVPLQNHAAVAGDEQVIGRGGPGGQQGVALRQRRQKTPRLGKFAPGRRRLHGDGHRGDGHRPDHRHGCGSYDGRLPGEGLGFD